MIRSLLFFFFFMIVYAALKTLFRSAVRAYHQDERRPASPPGEEMVLDPECRTYVPKGRAVSRRVQGTIMHFCSETCAKQYEEKKRT